MGFAGQVFAARVAVGLALPSPKAFSQAGSMIGGFASKMYNSLNKKSIQAAQKQLATAKSNLDKAKATIQTHSKSQDAFLTNAAAGAVSRLNSAYGGLAKSAVKSAGAIKGLKGTISKGPVKGKLFAGVTDDMKDGEQYAKMMENFVKLQKHERAEIFRTYEAQKLALKAKIKGADETTKAGALVKKVATADLELLNVQVSEFKHYDNVRKDADAEYAFDKKKNMAVLKKATKDAEEAQKELNEMEESGIEIQKRFMEGTSAFVTEIKTGFIEALRESISVLSAFYYKLNQNTQELIEFERELMNANSVFGVTRDELFATGDTVVQFGQRFGLEMQNGATGLYQLASAGLSAAESMEVLTETLKLSMAVQGDHNTISKLVTQTLFGFDMEMSQAGLIADKFAFAIQKSLIEYQDLASAVKFALPFFTTTGQSIDQLLGALQILTNRALEAGIAGRGLRQGLAELAESIGDNTARFREFGIEVTDAQGNMLQLTEIAANFSNVLNAGIINDTELLTTLIEDLNVRGATAFVHLVQASDEFTQAVEDTANAGGQLDEMVRIQNESIAAQIQILKNNVGLMFLWRDANYEGTRFQNAFHEAVLTTVESFRALLVVEKDGVIVLTEFGLAIQKLAVEGIKEMRKMLDTALPLLDKFVQVGALGIQVFKVYLIPIKLLIGILDKMGPTLAKVLISFHLMNKLLPITAMLNYVVQLSFMRKMPVLEADALMTARQTVTQGGYSAALFTTYLINNLSIKGLYKRIAAQIYALTIGKLRLFLETALAAQRVRSNILLGVENGYMLAQFSVGRASITQNIWKNILEAKFIVIQTIRLALSKKVFGVGMANFNLGRKDLLLKHTRVSLDNMSLATLLRLYIVEKSRWVLSKIQYALDVIRINIRLALFYLLGTKLGLKKTDLALTNASFVMKLRLFYLDKMIIIQKRINLIIDGIRIKYQKIMLLQRNMSMPGKIMEILLEKKLWKSKAKTNVAEGVGIIQRITDTLIRIGRNFVKGIELILDWALYFVLKVGGLLSFLVNIVQKLIMITVGWLWVSYQKSTLWQDIKGNFVRAIKLVIMIALTAAIVVQTVATWAWNIALYANPVGLIVLAVALLIIGLVVLAIRMREQFDIWTIFKVIIGNVIGMLLYPFILVGKLFMLIGSKIGEVLEGPMFKVAMFIKHFFMMLKYYVVAAGQAFMEKIIVPLAAKLGWLYSTILKPYLINPIIYVLKLIWDGVKALIGFVWPLIKKFWGLLKDNVLDPLWGHIKGIWDMIKAALGALGNIAGKAKDVLGNLNPFAQGGYITMAAAGAVGAGPYLVGERGPELFVPQGPGQVIPNKDLNTQRVKNMLSDYTAPGAGADKAFQRMASQTMVVESLEVRKANLKQSRLGIDSFGGYM